MVFFGKMMTGLTRIRDSSAKAHGDTCDEDECLLKHFGLVVEVWDAERLKSQGLGGQESLESQGSLVRAPVENFPGVGYGILYIPFYFPASICLFAS